MEFKKRRNSKMEASILTIFNSPKTAAKRRFFHFPLKSPFSRRIIPQYVSVPVCRSSGSAELLANSNQIIYGSSHEAFVFLLRLAYANAELPLELKKILKLRADMNLHHFRRPIGHFPCAAFGGWSEYPKHSCLAATSQQSFSRSFRINNKCSYSNVNWIWSSGLHASIMRTG